MSGDVFLEFAVTSHTNTKLSSAAFGNVAVNTSPSPVGSATIAMGSDVFVGLAVTSHANVKLSTAVFDNVN